MTYADLFASQPFRNQLVTLTLTGKQIKDMLEQQWREPKRPRILQVSKGFQLRLGQREAVTASASSPNDDAERTADRSRRDLSRHRQQLPGVRRRRLYGVAGRNRAANRHYDSDALFAYFRANSPVGPTAVGRIIRIN